MSNHAPVLRGRMRVMRTTPTVVFLALCALGNLTTAQETTAQEQEKQAPRTAIERNLEALADPAQRHAAMVALWKEGPPAVPMLAGAVQRGGDAAAPALRVLWQLGGEAAPAAPVLQRALAKAPAPLRDEIALTLARIDGPPCILVSRHEHGEIVQVDFDGKVVRSAKCLSPWGIWPLPEDRLGVVSFSQGSVLQIDWQGLVLQSRKIVNSMTSFVPIEDGDHITTNWDGDGRFARRAPDGTVRWSHTNDAFRSMRFLDEVLVVTRKPPQLVTYSLAGEELRKVALPTPCCGVFPLPDGHTMLTAHSGQILEIDAAGAVVGELKVEGIANDVVRLRDGRTVVSAAAGLFLFAKDGSITWHLADLGQCGPMFVRVPW